MSIEIKFGGVLEVGDFIAISDGNYMQLGWYFGQGRGTLQYLSWRVPGATYKSYLEHLVSPTSLSVIRFKNGTFTTKSMWKGYISAVHRTRVIKISHPETLFTNPEDLQEYQDSVEALKILNFIKTKDV